MLECQHDRFVRARCERVKVALYSRVFPPSTGWDGEIRRETLARWLASYGHELVVLSTTEGGSRTSRALLARILAGASGGIFR